MPERRDIREKILRYNAQVPRYTSYPTAPHFEASDDSAYKGALPASAGRLSLYLHLPYCRQMCLYCGCHAMATRKYEPVAAYVGQLLREIEAVCALLPARMPVSHIHFGGGSPDHLAPEDFLRLMSSLSKHFDILPDAEIALEADPRGITPEKAIVYGIAGVTRASLGVQDFSPHVQEAIGRIQPYDVVATAVERLRGAGVERLNLDLMYGLPAQTLEDAANTADKALALVPDRLSVFGYAHVPWMKKRMSLIDETTLPDAALRIDQFAAMQDVLTSHGFVPVGIDHFAQAGDSLACALRDRRLTRNFQGYSTDDAQNLIGFGVSSIGRVGGAFYQNTPDIAVYGQALDEGRLPVARMKPLDSADRLRAQLISELMCYFEADTAALLHSHGFAADYFDATLDSLADLVADGLVERKDGMIRINPAARQIARVAAARFDAYFAANARRHAQAA